MTGHLLITRDTHVTVRTEKIRTWNPAAGEWVLTTVPVPEPAPRRRPAARRAPRVGAPRNLAGLSDGAPIPSWWRYTAFAPGTPLADMRSYLPAPAMRTHRAAAVVPASPEVYAPPLAR
jgi:hypothetical protein